MLLDSSNEIQVTATQLAACTHVMQIMIEIS